MTPAEPPPPPARRVVILGASNVMRGLGHLVDAARGAWGSPLDLLVATGYGRSYGMDSRVLGRSLPGILDCGIWRTLAQRPPGPTAALITDIGNDILYGAPTERIVAWVEECLTRVRERTETIVVTRLPLAGIDTLGPTRFRLVRALLFPSSSVSLETARAAAHVVDERITAAAQERGAHVVSPDPAWYGLDPVHVRHGRRHHAWRTILAPWAGGADPPFARLDAIRRLHLRSLLPERRTFFGIEQRRNQPATSLPDGSHLSLF